VLWNASTPIAGSIDAINALKAAGKTVVFVTNNATKSRATYVAKFKKLGFEGVNESEINTSASASADYCRQQGYNKAFVIGEVGLREELMQQQVEVIWDEGCQGMSDDDFLEAIRQIDNGGVDVVVVGWDKNFSYRKLCLASLHLQVCIAIFNRVPEFMFICHQTLYGHFREAHSWW
jgi:HAD superfamily hydrolase (TIGR01450 family)